MNKPPENISELHAHPDLERARTAVAGATCRILTDGKMGDVVQCLGVAERLGLTPEQRIVRPRAPWHLAMPWGPIDPNEAADQPESPISPPFPDIAIASGRRAAPYLRAIKQASGGKTLTVFLKDPRSGTQTADLLWVPEHDRLRGENVLVTLTSPHRIAPEALEAARAKPTPWQADGRRLVALVLGGNSKDFRFSHEDNERLFGKLQMLIREGAQIIATASRRTPARLRQKITDLVQNNGGYFWDDQGENPYHALLAHAEAIVVTADSVNMVGEACATGRPVLVYTPTKRLRIGGSRKLDHFLNRLEGVGAIRPFQGRFEAFSYEPQDSTPLIACAIAELFAKHQGKQL